MADRPASVKEYLDALAPDRRQALEAIRAVIRKNLDPAFEEGIQYGMIGYYLPHSVYPAGYHCDPKQPLPYASIASQKNHIGIYLFCIYGSESDAERFREEWLATGKRLDMGKACVRAKKLDDVPLPVIGRAIKRMSAKKFVAHYESALAQPRGKAAGTKKTAAKKSVGKKTTGTKTVGKKKPTAAKQRSTKRS